MGAPIDGPDVVAKREMPVGEGIDRTHMQGGFNLNAVLLVVDVG